MQRGAARVGAMIACSLLAIKPVNGQPPPEPKLAHLETASRSLGGFRQDRIQDLRLAVRELEAAQDNLVGAPDTQRDKATLVWFDVFRAIDQALDPAFDPEDVGLLNLAPPAMGGVGYPSGVDPSAIPDPRVRAQYETDLAKNRAKIERYNYQDGLRRVDQYATSSFDIYANCFYGSSASSRAEFERLVDEAKLGVVRTAQLKRAGKTP